ncbi:MAG: tyrosine recombinase XerD [Treponema sp.]|nr:tyrosine recombinase XerD [Treponema sp.]
MLVESLPRDFYNDLVSVERLSEKTAETYTCSVQLFLQWIGGKKMELSSVGTKDLIYYLVWRTTEGIDELTVAKDISALRAFGAFLVRSGLWYENVASLLERPKSTKALPRVLSVEQVDSLLSSIDVGKPLGIRDRALFELIYSCGLRISEACSLLTENLHLGEKIIIVHGKGDKERMVPFGNTAKEWLEKYICEVRPILAKNRIVPEVFLNYQGKPLSRKGVWKNFQAFEAKAGVTAKVHTLRHSFATHLLAGGLDLRSVQELLGHADLATTQIYTHIENKQLKESHEKFFPGHGTV